jgi:GGDEF domain-containing protein
MYAAMLEAQRVGYETLLDEETGLPTWPLLLDRVTVALAHARRTGRELAVFVIEEPRVGRRVRDMKLVSQMLQAKLRSDDTLARIGERRLVALCSEIRHDEDAAAVALRLIAGAGIVCHLGIAQGSIDDTPETLLARAIEEAVRTSPTV